MNRIAVAILSVAILAGCSTIRQNQAADAYNAQIASNASEYGNGQIQLSEKLRRDYIAGVQYGQINKIEAACIQAYMWIAKDFEKNYISEDSFNDNRDRLEVACAHSYATGNYIHVDVWRTGYAMSTVNRR